MPTKEERRMYTRPKRANGSATCVTCFAICCGLTMVVMAEALGDKCKMRAIDSSTFDHEGERGNLPKWFRYTGAVVLTSGLFACCMRGGCPMMPKRCSPCGCSCANVMTSVVGKLLLTIFIGMISLCTLIGCFWLCIAHVARTPHNSTEEGDENYCHPVLWNSGWFFLGTLFLAILVGTYVVCAKTVKVKHYDILIILEEGKKKEAIRVPRRK